MEEKRIERLYELLERAEKEKDSESVSALRWAIFTLEQTAGMPQESEKYLKDEFTAEKITFENMSGYMVRQNHNGKTRIKQFITEEDFEQFCKITGIFPKMDD